MKRILIGLFCLLTGCVPPPDHRDHHYRPAPPPYRHRPVREIEEPAPFDFEGEWSEEEEEPEPIPAETPEIAPEEPKIAPTDGTVKSVSGGVGDFVRSADVLVLEWTAGWCGPCQTLKPKLEEMAKEFAGDGVVFGSADFDALKAESDGVTTLPRTRVYKNGEMTAEFEGVKTEEIRNAVRDALGSAE